ncbi:MAG TPA: enoyl-CoA hydratase-related protein [Steroidobacteraceae bacterium]|jgi:enoyl-CoA hydratase/carnithine racemase|nr:enoyl-CoA hydratase-related protein [Steroidobacteraceae bacterium]
MSIDYETDGHVARITINRPHAMNAIDSAHNKALEEAWRRLNEDPQIRAGVLTGAGSRAFCAGADLKELIPSHHAAVRKGQRTPWTMGGITLEPHFGKPMIAAVNGHALAGGMELALACDIRLCAPHATFGLAETKWALIPGAGGTQRLPRTVPLGWAMEMILTGDPIDAPTALRIGLVNRVLPIEQLAGDAMRLAATIASRGPLAVTAARRAILEGLTLGLAAGLSNERDRFADIMKTDDALEGATAFAEKRNPHFQGR